MLTLSRLVPQYLVFSVLKRRRSLQELARRAWTDPSGTNGRRAHAETAVVAGVVRLHNLLGGPDDDCVPRSLLLYRELSRLGADPTLCIGFKRAEAALLGHAWVEVDGHAVGEVDVQAAGFATQLTFGKRGVQI